MLQTLQLSRLSQTFEAEIAELRSFLAAAGLPVESQGSLPAMTSRLEQDRAFHRDLVSYLWLITDAHDDVRPADLLAVLALAAAGERWAAAADEDTAHKLLRFIIEARRSFRGAQPAAEPAGPTEPPAHGGLRSATTPAPAILRETDDRALEMFVRQRMTELPQDRSRVALLKRNRLVFAAIAACVLLAVGFGLWHSHRETTDSVLSTTTAPEPPSVAESPSVASKENLESVLPYAIPGGKSPFVPRSARAVRSVPEPARTPTPWPQTLPATVAAAAAPPAVVIRVPAEPAAATPPAAYRAAPSTVSSGIVPDAVLNSRLSVPVDTAAYDPAYAVDPRHPKLHRRPAKADAGLLAAAEPYASPADAELSGTVRAPVVRQTSLGMMAGNLLYSPPTPYPAQASAMHVQGQVKLQTEIDRDGNVASARVISGPPLLRDAALEAVLQWRYRPLTRGSKPAPASAIAVLDFELP